MGGIDSVRSFYLIDFLLDVGERSFSFQPLSTPFHDDWLRLKDIIALHLVSLNTGPSRIRLEISTHLFDDPVHNIDAIMSLKGGPISINVSIKLILEDSLLTFAHGCVCEG